VPLSLPGSGSGSRPPIAPQDTCCIGTELVLELVWAAADEDEDKDDDEVAAAFSFFCCRPSS
jgi:hypothetical protein